MNAPSERKISVMHACQWRLFREGVKNALAKNEDIEFIGEAADGKELLELIKIKKPDVIILDIRMPIMNGIQTLAILKKRFPDIRVIFLTMYSDPSFIVRTLELGANAYLTADAEAGEIYHALFSCFKPGIYLSTRARQYLTRTFDFLSANEIKIIKSLSRDINSEIMAKEIGFSPEIIEEIIEKLKKMAQVSTSEELVELARKMGFIERKEVPQKHPKKTPIWRRLRFT